RSCRGSARATRTVRRARSATWGRTRPAPPRTTAGPRASSAYPTDRRLPVGTSASRRRASAPSPPAAARPSPSWTRQMAAAPCSSRSSRFRPSRRTRCSARAPREKSRVRRSASSSPCAATARCTGSTSTAAPSTAGRSATAEAVTRSTASGTTPTPRRRSGASCPRSPSASTPPRTAACSSLPIRWGDGCPRSPTTGRTGRAWPTSSPGCPTAPSGSPPCPPRLLSEGSVAEQAPGFLVTFRNAAQVNLLRFLGEDDSRRSRLVDVAETPLTVNTLGVDSRGIAIDDPRPRARAVCDELPAEERDGCLAEAERLPLDVYVANRTPPSLIVGRTREVTATGEPRDLPTFHDSIPLTAGPSRVVVGNVLVDDGTPEGRPERRIFVLCFDSNLIYVYDPEERRIEAEISTGRGPHALAFDREPPLACRAHFTASYVGVVSLDHRSPWNYGALIASIGTPRPPRASK